MKKSLRWLSALFAVVMLLSAAMTTVMATDSEEDESVSENYLLSQLKNAYRLSDGTWVIPYAGGWFALSDEEYNDLWTRYFYGIMYPSLYPDCVYPGLGGYNPFYTIEIEVAQFASKFLGLGDNYTYYSTDPSVATVTSYGHVVGVSEGTCTIICNSGNYTRILVNVTVTAADLENSNVQLYLNVSDDTLYIGQTATVSAYLLRYPNFPIYGVAVDLAVTEGDDVISLSEKTVSALKEGTAKITATYGDFEETIEITVSEKAVPSYPSYPSYPFPPFYPSYPNFTYPWYDVNYPIYGTYPWWNIVTPEFGNSSINWEKILEIDTDTYDVEKKYSYINGTWMRTFTLIPKDGTEVEEYDTVIRRVYVTSEWTVVAIKTPAGYEPAPVEPEVDQTLTKEELEALKKAEEAAKKEAALKEKIAKAMEGKLEWYQVYSDLWGDSYYTEAVKYCLEEGYVTGNDDYVTFGTSEKITWAVLEDVLCVYLGVTEEELAALKLFSYEDSDEAITREQIALAIYNVAKHLKLNVSDKAALGSYKDYADLDAKYADAFAWAVKAKVLNKSSEKIDPNGSVDKARLCQILYKLDSIKK